MGAKSPPRSKKAVKPVVTVPLPDRVFTDIPAVERHLGDDGQYRYVIDTDSLYAVAMTHASFEQLATVFKVPLHVLTDGEYREVIDQARAEQLVGLRSAQFKAAVEDRNPAMLIWLGKQHLGQKELVQTQQLDEKGNPIGGMFSGATFVVHMPPNGRDLDPTRKLQPADEVKALPGSGPA